MSGAALVAAGLCGPAPILEGERGFFAAMCECGRYPRLDAIATVTDLRMERILRRAGWGLARLGEPQQIGTTKAVAGLLPVTDSALAAVCAAGKISGRVYEDHTCLAIAA